MPLEEFINKHYGGNQAAFAYAIGKSRQHVNLWLKSGDWFVIDGYLYQRKLKIE